MLILAALILGLVQGVTEFIPVSSSAHLEIVAELMGAPKPGVLFSAVISIGTELALLVYLWPEVKVIVLTWVRSFSNRALRRDPASRMAWYVILGTIPVGVAGLAANRVIGEYLRGLWLAAAMLVLFGLLLGLADTLSSRKRALSDMRSNSAVLIGLAQILALVPGVSRSGSTITAGLALGFSRVAAVKFSFLLALPVTFLSGFYELVKGLLRPEAQAYNWLETFLALVVAFVVGYAVVRAFMRFITRHSFVGFVYYRVILGILLFIALGFGWLSP